MEKIKLFLELICLFKISDDTSRSKTSIIRLFESPSCYWNQIVNNYCFTFLGAKEGLEEKMIKYISKKQKQWFNVNEKSCFTEKYVNTFFEATGSKLSF